MSDDNQSVQCESCVHPGHQLAIEVLARQAKSELLETVTPDEFPILREWLHWVFATGRKLHGPNYEAFIAWAKATFHMGENDFRLLNKIVAKTNSQLEQDAANRRKHEQQEREQQERERTIARLGAQVRRSRPARPTPTPAPQRPSKYIHSLSSLGHAHSELRLESLRDDIEQASIALPNESANQAMLAAVVCTLREISDSLSQMPKNIARQISKCERAEEIALERAKRDAAKAEAKACDAKRRLIEARPPVITMIQMPNDDIENEYAAGNVLRTF